MAVSKIMNADMRQLGTVCKFLVRVLYARVA